MTIHIMASINGNTPARFVCCKRSFDQIPDEDSWQYEGVKRDDDGDYCDTQAKPRYPACMLCFDDVTPNDTAADGTWYDQAGSVRVVHRECGLRSVLGGIGHLTNHDYWCKENVDPDGGHTYRRSAQLVWVWVQKNGRSL